MKATARQGFTLIELSIVLVIIGLIVGGILVGRDLIQAAAVRAQVTQFEKYNSAVNTFRGKYAYLPGDIKDPDASNFGFRVRGPYPGEGDGNGLLEGVSCNVGICNQGSRQTAENLMFWVDLGTARLLEENMSAATGLGIPGADITGTALANYLPQARIGRSNYLYVSSGGWSLGTAAGNDGVNYLSISAATLINGSSSPGRLNSGAGLTVQEAYNIDTKMDDGLPQSGRVTALRMNGATSATLVWSGSLLASAPYITATPGSSTSCFDNGNLGGTQQYSLTQSNGSGVNCGLSVKLQ